MHKHEITSLFKNWFSSAAKFPSAPFSTCNPPNQSLFRNKELHNLPLQRTTTPCVVFSKLCFGQCSRMLSWRCSSCGRRRKRCGDRKKNSCREGREWNPNFSLFLFCFFYKEIFEKIGALSRVFKKRHTSWCFQSVNYWRWKWFDYFLKVGEIFLSIIIKCFEITNALLEVFKKTSYIR